jgi:hypothetical protein
LPGGVAAANTEGQGERQCGGAQGDQDQEAEDVGRHVQLGEGGEREDGDDE